VATQSQDTNVNIAAPALPPGPATYSKSYLDQLTNILRLYFNQVDNAVRNAVANTVPYNLRVSQGNVAGATSLYKFGYNSDVGTSEETIWAEGGIYAYPSSAATVYVSSTDANDAFPSGTGARTIRVFGLNENYLEVSADVELNGQTQVETTGVSFIRVFRAFVLTSGSGGTAAGTIYVGTSGGAGGVPPVVYANLSTGNQTQLALYTVPANKTLYLDDVVFTAGISLANNYATVSLLCREFGSNTFRTKVIQTIQSNELVLPFTYPLAFPAKSDIECRAVATSVGNAISAAFSGVLIEG
jgi:hypothetical protein